MVDINLFKEEGEEEQKPDEDGENLGDELNEDFGLGDEDAEPSPF